MTDQDERLSKLEGWHKTLTDEVHRQGADIREVKQDTARALAQSAEALTSTQSSHRILTEHVDHANAALALRIDTHLEQQDKHLQRQDKAMEDLKGPISVLHQAELERAAKAQAEAAVARDQESNAKRRRTKRNDILKNGAAIIGIVSGLGAVFGAWRAFAVWALHLLHLSAR